MTIKCWTWRRRPAPGLCIRLFLIRPISFVTALNVIMITASRRREHSFRPRLSYGDYIKKLVDFLLEIELDMAEFTVLTPFPHTRTFDDLHNAKRISSYDWNDYTCGKVVFQPKLLSLNNYSRFIIMPGIGFMRKNLRIIKCSRCSKSYGKRKS